jgi:hypothetical protein
MLVYVMYGHLEHFRGIWDILWTFGTFCVHLVHFSGLGIMYQEKSGNPGPNPNYWMRKGRKRIVEVDKNY